VLVAAVSNSVRADTVVYATGREGGGRATATGTIADFTGERLVLRTAAGIEREIPTPQVEEIQTDWPPEKLAADRAMEEGKYEEAVVSYQRALGEERRVWAQRELVARLVSCYDNLDQFDLAGEAFLRLVASDPQTHHFASMPLSWTPFQPSPDFERRAATWLERKQDPISVLMGASWLLSTGRRGDATEALRRLASDRDPRIAALAQAQLWRTRIVTATPDEIQRWDRLISAMPADLRGGAYFVLGRALAARSQHEKAAVALLRAPLLYPADRRLAAAALLSAGRQLEKIGQEEEAITLYREVVRDHSDEPAAAEAATRLEALTGRG
jgi:tetratricopeptide (TPR) repeat protein